MPPSLSAMKSRPYVLGRGLPRPAIFIAALVFASGTILAAAQSSPPASPPAGTAPAKAPASTPASATGNAPAQSKIPADQLDALVAPIALFPDPLLAQTLAASTYPLEIVQLQQWLAKNPG